MKSALAVTVALFLAAPVFAQEWKPLFDGYSFDGWTMGNGEAVDLDESPAWEVTDGMLHLDRSKGKGGAILTDRDYGDFEMLFEWKVAPKSNNGIKYRVQRFDRGLLGLEYQVIDDPEHPNLAFKHKTASIYDVYDAKEHSVLNPADTWNRGRIVVRNNQIEHWLNGHLITRADVESEDWNEHIAASKFSDVPGFGTNALGRIMITDHQDEVWYRNIFIREFPNSAVTGVAQLAAKTTTTKCVSARPRCSSVVTKCPSPSRTARRFLFRRRR